MPFDVCPTIIAKFYLTQTPINKSGLFSSFNMNDLRLRQ